MTRVLAIFLDGYEESFAQKLMAAGEMPEMVRTAVETVPGLGAVKVNMVFDPPWDQSRMSDEARVALDMW